MVQLQLLLVSLAAVASVSAVPANQQRINPNFAPKPGQKFQQKFGGNKGKAPAAMWFQPGGVPNKYRPSAGGAASFRGRPGRRPNKGGNNGAGNAGAGNGNAGAGNANAGAGNGNQNNAGGNGNNNNAGTGNNNNNAGNGGSNNAVDGAQDTGIANVVELCTNPDGRTACFMILGDTKGSCFTIPHPIADNVQFFLPPPGGTCSLFDDQDCNAAALAPAQGVVAQTAKLAWSCTAAAAAAPPATTTTAATTAATTTTTTSSAAATTTSKANNGGKGNAGKGNAGKGNTGKGNQAGAGKGNTGAAKGNTGAAKGNTGAAAGAGKGNTGANTGANAGKGNTGAGKGNTGATAGKGNQANAGSGSGTNNAVAGSQNLDFGSCTNPTIQFAQGLPGRNAKEFGFQAVNTQDFPHGAALNIGVITDFVCLQFINKCGLKQDSPTIAACRAAEQAALPLQGGAAADAFNKGLGFDTNFAAVGGNGNNGGNNNGGNNNGNNGGNNNGNNVGNNGANGQTDSGVANVIEGCTNPDGATRCFQILADTKESCFTLPPPLANNVAFWLPPPGANCVLFTDQDCTSTPTTAFGVINNVKQNSWSCKLNDA